MRGAVASATAPACIWWCTAAAHVSLTASTTNTSTPRVRSTRGVISTAVFQDPVFLRRARAGFLALPAMRIGTMSRSASAASPHADAAMG